MSAPAAQKAPFGVDGLHGHRRAHHDHDQRPLLATRQQAVARTDHGHPTVGPQAQRVVVAVHQPGLLHGRHHPLRRHVPLRHLLHLLTHTALHGITRHHAAQDARRRRQGPPGMLGQTLNMLQELGTMREQCRARARRVVQRPFEAGVANVYGQKSHRARLSRVLRWRLPPRR